MKEGKYKGLTGNEVASVCHYVRFKLGMASIGIKLSEGFLNRPEVQNLIREELEMYERTGAIQIRRLKDT